MNITTTQIEHRIRTLQARLPFCHVYGEDPLPLEDEIAALKAQLRATHGPAGAEKRGDLDNSRRD